ncbi:MAG: hypothetical protein VX667_02755 [Nitrospinota bacterium]|nr:hypothetical protein [Nitrospinota bacterium]
MIFPEILFPVIVVASAFLFRRPFVNFPLDDDFSIYTYRARFARKGFQWKKDLQIIGVPMWKMLLFDKAFDSPDGGVQRIRLIQTLFHAAASAMIFFAVFTWTHNPWAALAAGILHAFYGTSPDLTAGSFNHEQFYLPLVLLGLTFLVMGPDYVIWAGLCFGLATIPKYTAGLYAAVLMWVVGYRYGFDAMTQFILAAGTPFILSNLLDWKLGFWDAKSKTQMNTRLATTLRLSRTKTMYFNVAGEILLLAKQGLPIWAAGIPSLLLALSGENGIWLGTFTMVTLSMIVFQRGFSRYHYLPWFTLLAFGCGLGLDMVLKEYGNIAPMITGLFLVLTGWNIYYLKDFYLKPTSPETLSGYEKFDQYLYLPRLGKALKRLIRMRGETDHRIFAWGTFTQLYHLTGQPSSDNYLHHSIGPWDTQDLEGFYDGVIGGLIRHQPIYLIKTYLDLHMDLLEELTGLRYKLIKVYLSRFAVYRLEAFTPPARDPLLFSWEDKMRVMDALTGEQLHSPGINPADLVHENVEKARRECLKLLRMNPEDMQGRVFLGEIYAQLGRINEAVAQLEYVLSRKPGWSFVRLSLATQLVKQGRLQEAESLVREEKRRFDYDIEMSYVSGLVYRGMRDHRSTAETFSLVAGQQPERIDCWEFMIDALTELQDRAQLEKLYTNTTKIELKNDREWVQTKIAAALAKIQAPQRPEYEVFESYLNLDPSNILMQYARASAFERAANTEDARRLFNMIATTAHNYAHIRANAWFRLARLVPQDQQETPIQNCLELDPSHEGARKLLDTLNSLQLKETPV